MYPGFRGCCARGTAPFIVLFGVAFASLAADTADVSPEHVAGARKVSAEEVFSLFEKTRNLVIVDSRLASGPSSGRANGYIEGSVSLPDTETNCASLAKAIPRKTTPSLFYCNGPKCGRSAKAIKVAQQCGYNNIYWFRGGFEEWLKKGYPFVKP